MSETDLNEEGVESFLDLSYHVGIGAVASAGIGLFLILTCDGLLLVLGIVLVIIGTGVLVDTWVHGYFH